ncbi:MAG TPA: hypothetical protein VNC84_07375 [Gammaproteobacteria bacterium]|jgi:hypothetical protein|nr:hypothetical protein [Gammaproteobacteria bacterium]
MPISFPPEEAEVQKKQIMNAVREILEKLLPPQIKIEPMVEKITDALMDRGLTAEDLATPAGQEGLVLTCVYEASQEARAQAYEQENQLKREGPRPSPGQNRLTSALEKLIPWFFDKNRLLPDMLQPGNDMLKNEIKRRMLLLFETSDKTKALSDEEKMRLAEKISVSHAKNIKQLFSFVLKPTMQQATHVEEDKEAAAQRERIGIKANAPGEVQAVIQQIVFADLDQTFLMLAGPQGGSSFKDCTTRIMAGLDLTGAKYSYTLMNLEKMGISAIGKMSNST